MSSILRPGYLRWDGLKYVLDPDIEIVGPPGTPGPPGPAGSSGASTLIYRPGGVTAQNVYAVWTDLMTARNLIQGPVAVIIDDSIVSPAPIDVGVWNLGHNTPLLGAIGNQQEFSGNPLTQLLIPDGAQLLDPNAFYNLDITGNSTALPSIETAGNDLLNFQAWDCIFRNAGTSGIPLIHTSGGNIDLYGACHLVASNNSSYIISDQGDVGTVNLNINDNSVVDGYSLQMTGSPTTVTTTGHGSFGFAQPGSSLIITAEQSNIIQTDNYNIFTVGNPSIIATRPLPFFSPVPVDQPGNINLCTNNNGSGLAGITGTANYSTIVGGLNHQIQDGTSQDFIGGGFFNTIGEDVHHGPNVTASTIVGGQDNGVFAIGGFIGGGTFNTITGGEGNSSSESSAIVGGDNNQILGGAGGFMGGGINNVLGDGTNTNLENVIVGGSSSGVTGSASRNFIGGGNGHGITGASNSVIVGGSGNGIFGGSNATIGGGTSNQVFGNFGCVPGGASNVAGGQYSFACGVAANASREMQWAYSGSGVFVSLGDQPQYSMFFVKGESTNAAAVQLSADLFTPTPLNLADGVAYMIRATCVANRTNGAGRATFIHTLLAHASTGVAVIDNDNLTMSVPNGQTWTIVYTVSGPNIIATFTGTAGHVVRATVLYEFVELPGGV